MNNPVIFSHKKGIFLSDIVCDEWLRTFDSESRQIFYFNI